MIGNLARRREKTENGRCSRMAIPSGALSHAWPLRIIKLLSCKTVAAANSAYFCMPRDEFGHLEHADLLLATKDHLQGVIGVDQSPLLLVLVGAALRISSTSLATGANVLNSISSSGASPCA